MANAARARRWLFVGIGAAACSEPGTSTDATPISANQIVEADVTPGVRTRFVFETAAYGFKVYFQTTSGTATISVSLNGAELVRRLDATPSTDPLDGHAVGQVNVTGSGRFEVVLTGAGHARFKLVELPPTPAPRTTSASESVGRRGHRIGLASRHEIPLVDPRETP